jgi:pectinesterase
MQFFGSRATGVPELEDEMKALSYICLCTLLVITMGSANASAGERANIIVDTTGNGNFKTIQEAINSIPSDNRRDVVILIRSGLYNEKVFIQKSHITLVGEDRDSTRIIYAELRENWNKDHGGSDWGSGVVNIDTGVTDITLANLTVYNNYGWQKGVFNKHQFAIRGDGTRIILLNCRVVSDGGDALSLWNKENGMYYHADCYFEGWVDYVCPRGWCYISNSRFFSHNKPSASIWHDGSNDKDQKFVIRDSYFDGVPGFPLGRNHLDAQIYLINCRFSERMANRPFYRPPSSPREWQWGARHYFYNCHRDGGGFNWFKDNLDKAENSPRASEITAKWTFDGKWDPEATMPAVLPFSFLPTPKRNASNVSTDGARLTWVSGRNADSHNVHLGKSNPPEFRGNQKEAVFDPGRLESNTTYFWRVDEVTSDGVVPGELWSFRTE